MKFPERSVVLGRLGVALPVHRQLWSEAGNGTGEQEGSWHTATSALHSEVINQPELQG